MFKYSADKHLQFLHAHWIVFLLLFESLCSSNLLWQLRKCKKNNKKKTIILNYLLLKSLSHNLFLLFCIEGFWFKRMMQKEGRESERGWPWSSLMQSVQGLNANQTEAFPHAYSSAHTSCQPLQCYTHTATYAHTTDPRTLPYSIKNSNPATFALFIV